jgi:hypothetical protein
MLYVVNSGGKVRAGHIATGNALDIARKLQLSAGSTIQIESEGRWKQFVVRPTRKQSRTLELRATGESTTPKE